MELDKEPVQALLDATKTKRFGRAPRAVIDAVASFLGDASPDLVFPTAEAPEGSTVWRVALLKGDLFIWVEASRKGTNWSFEPGYYGEEEPDAIDAWARPLARVDEVRLTQVHRHDDRVANTWRWDAGYEVVFDDGKRVEFSPFASGQGEPFVAELLRRISRR